MASVGLVFFARLWKSCLFITFRGTIVQAPETMLGDENILDVQWMDVERAEERMPYYPNGIRAFLKQAHGTEYVIQR